MAGWGEGRKSWFTQTRSGASGRRCRDRGLRFLRPDRKGETVAVRIRMQMIGRKHRPYYRIVAIDSRQPRNGRAMNGGHFELRIEWMRPR